MNGIGSRSARVENSWPSFTKVGPSSSRSRASGSAIAADVVSISGGRSSSASSSPERLTKSERPYFQSSPAISR
jgi:hypothetical protein